MAFRSMTSRESSHQTPTQRAEIRRRYNLYARGFVLRALNSFYARLFWRVLRVLPLTASYP
jgi:hypothetical protein